MEEVDEKRPVIDPLEMVLVSHAFEVAIDHFVGKREGAIHGGDPGFEDPCLHEMFGLPGDGLVQTDQARRSSGDGCLIGMSHGFSVQVDATGEVKYAVGRGRDEGR